MSPFGRINHKLLGATAGLMLMAAGGVAQAVVILPGPAGTTIEFQDNAFADALLDSFGTFDTNPPGSTLDAVLTDTSVETSAFSFDPSAFVELGFTDNLPVDGTGADIALYDLGTPSGTFDITIGVTTLRLTSQSTGTTNADDIALNVLLIDLADFLVAETSSLVIGMDILSNGGVFVPPDLALVAAINNFVSPPIPVPGVLALMIAGLAGLGFVRRGARPAL